MAGRTSQLQIRVSPEQKEALRRLAATSGQSVSAYVLSRALPETGEHLVRVFDDFRRGGDQKSLLATLTNALATLERDQLEAALATCSVNGMTPLAQNRVAALVEEATVARCAELPAWAAGVPPLGRPHFRWPIPSLRAYQLRATRVAFKRRNVFDPHVPMAGVLEMIDRRVPPELASLAEYLAGLEIDVEFYFIGGAVYQQCFPSLPRNARPSSLFGPPAEADPVAGFARQRGWDPAHLAQCVRATIASSGVPGPWLALPHLTVFQPPAAYALATKIASLPVAPSPSDLADLRLLLRVLDLTSLSAVSASVGRYIADRHLPAHAPQTVRDLLGT